MRVAGPAPGPASSTAIRLRLEQALGNLVDNALRHGEGTIRLEAARRDGTSSCTSSDEGPGFPAESWHRERSSASRAPTTPGRHRRRPRSVDRADDRRGARRDRRGGEHGPAAPTSGSRCRFTSPWTRRAHPGLHQRMAEFESAHRLRSSKRFSQRKGGPALSRPSTVILPEGQAAGTRWAHGGAWQMAERKPAKKGTQESAKGTTFSDEERAAMKERAES